MHRRPSTLPAFIALVCLGAIPHHASAQRVVDDDEWCQEDTGRSDEDRFCEVREYTMAPLDRVRVDASPNGGIEVEGWDRNEISLRAKVSTWSRRGNAASIAREIQIRTGDRITSDGPDQRSREGWSVSYRLMVPRSSDLDLESVNGGIRIFQVLGEMQFETLNGGIHLEDVGGEVRGRTTNGGLSVALSGDRWDGAGLDLQTTNGGIDLRLPEDFQATLETGTVNGGVDSDFPITLRGRFDTRRITTELNGGGPTLRAMTTNGGVRIRIR